MPRPNRDGRTQTEPKLHRSAQERAGRAIKSAGLYLPSFVRRRLLGGIYAILEPFCVFCVILQILRKYPLR